MSNPEAITAIADFAEELALRAGELIKHEREQNTLRTDYKQQTELVTHADVMADEMITGAIRERFPNHRILSEETMPDLSQAEHLDTPLWIIDPSPMRKRGGCRLAWYTPRFRVKPSVPHEVPAPS